MQNVQKRLDLIYPSSYELQFFDEEDTFLVVLKITGTHLNQLQNEA